MAKKATEIKLKMFADGANIEDIVSLKRNPLVSGFTTNPTLMRKSGVVDFEAFSREALEVVHPLPISLEVFEDNLEGMQKQARKISSWGENVYVKIPVTNTKGETTVPLISDLTLDGVKVNVTAVFTSKQFEEIVGALEGGTHSVISVFAGRIADAGVDPVPFMHRFSEMIAKEKQIELLWASPREILNVIQAEQSGCQIITMTKDLFMKLDLLGKPLEEFSLDTVKMFYEDALASKFNISI